jgi:hypothetical protein
MGPFWHRRSAGTNHSDPLEEIMSLSTPDRLDPFAVPHYPSGVPYDVLRRHVRGVVAVPAEPEYDDLVAAWNLSVQVRPAAVVAAGCAEDVVQTVRFAAREGLRVTPQATGHGAIADLVGDILISTKGLDECTVHPEGWARVGAGVKWLRVVEAAAPYGLAPLSGSITDVGVVGYTTGGGLGPMARTYGLASDRVRAFEVVTGDGVLRRVTPDDHPELYFGLRGGKGMLGIVTAVEFDLVEQPSFYGGSLWFDGADATAVIERWRTWAAALPELATTSFALFRLPDMEGVPAPLAGKLTLSIRYLWTGDAVEGERRFAEIRAAAPVILDDVALKPYTAVDSVHTDPLDPMPAHEHSALLSEFPAEAVEALVAVAGAGSDSLQVLVEVRQMGGATARGGEHDSAFRQRDAAFSVLLVSLELPGIEDRIDADAEAILAALLPWSLPGTLPNFTTHADRLPGCYDEATLARMRETLDRYDPQGVLAIGQLLRLSPASEGPAAHPRTAGR